MNRLPTPYHISYGAHLSIVEREVAKAREKDRREYKRRLTWVLVLNVLYLVSIRIAIDVMFKHPWMKEYQHLYPWSIGVLVLLFCLIWWFGTLYIFQRS